MKCTAASWSGSRHWLIISSCRHSSSMSAVSSSWATGISFDPQGLQVNIVARGAGAHAVVARAAHGVGIADVHRASLLETFEESVGGHVAVAAPLVELSLTDAHGVGVVDDQDIHFLGGGGVRDRHRGSPVLR